MRTIPSTCPDFMQSVQTALGNSLDLVCESLPGGVITVAYLSSITNTSDLQRNILGPLGNIGRNQDFTSQWDWETVLPVIQERGRIARDNMAEVIRDLLTGRTAVYLSGQSLAYTFETPGGAKRLPSDPKVERTVRGARNSFVESLLDNLSMIRVLMNDPSFRIDGLYIGRRTQTKVAVMYLKNVANPDLVAEVQRRLTRIDIDGIINTGYLEQLITDNRWSIFPLTQATERPDKVISAVLEGRVAVLAEGSSHALIVPTTINELYQSPEDYYWGVWFGSFLRFFRILGNNVAVALPGLYIALVGVNPEQLPIQFALSVSGSRMGVALPLVIELLVMEITIEIFREASLRLPQTVSQTLGVTTGIVLGIASVGAGLVSNATLVVVVITAIASYSGPDYAIGLSWRILKYILILAAASFGLIGLIVTGIAVLAHAAAQNSFGVSYLAPWTPIRGVELLDTIFRRPLWIRRRASTYHPTDKLRFQEEKPETGYGRREDE